LEFSLFKDGYNQWCQNWQRKGSEKHAKFLYSKLDYIPSIAWNDIVEESLVSLDRFPRLKDIIAMWYSWRASHSHQLIDDAPEEHNCKQCLGTGLLEYRHQPEDLVRGYLSVCACGYCENWKRYLSPKKWQYVKTYKLDDIEREDWEHIPPPEPCSKSEALDAIEIMFHKFGRKVSEEIPF
jgi:hypothetical protein